MHSADLNSKQVVVSDHGDLFHHQMVCYSDDMYLHVVWYSDHHLVNEPVFRPPFEYRTSIQLPGTMVPGI